MPSIPHAKTVLCIGETLIDLIASDGAGDLADVSAFAVRPGGAPANVAVALAGLGIPSSFCGVVGADPFGNRLRDELDRRGVATDSLRSTSDAETTLAFAWKDSRGDGHFRLIRMADRLLSSTDIDNAHIQNKEAIVIGSVALTLDPSRSSVIEAVKQAQVAGVPVCIDINIRPTLWPSAGDARAVCEPVLQGATLLKFSLDDARFLYGVDTPEAAIDALTHFNARHLVVTDGARGAWYDNPSASDIEFVPSFAVHAVDPTGAGDAFTAALISRLIAREWATVELDDLVYAAAAGAITTTKRGGIDALPAAEEIDTFLST